MKQRGIALIQVLLLSTILAVVLLSMNHQARQHIRLATAVQQYTQANLALHSAEAEIIYNLLSNQPFELQADNNSTAVQWNFHGKPFEFQQLTVRIQDTSGLLSASSPHSATLNGLVQQFGGSESQGREIAAALADWQDRNDLPRLDGAEQSDYRDITVRNGPIQYLEEWLFVKGVTPQLYQQLAPLISLFPQGVNVNQQPEAVWRANFPASEVNELVRARDAGELTPTLFYSITGITIDEFTRFAAGPSYRIHFTAKNADVRLGRELTLRLTPYQKQPFDIFEYRLRNFPTDTLNAASID